ncbi:GLPGLI family protein [Flavobacterium sp.]|uniref:GLPGLI family protein n=1 Tax=Flavobacterium sp. TaxID=239 RepID=UPI0037C052F7
MNRLIITVTIMVLLVCTKMMGQDFQGKAEYFSKFIFKTDKIKLDDGDKKEEDKELHEAVKLAMKKSSEKTYTLLFNKQEAVYEENEALEQPTNPNDGFSISVKMSGGGKKYINTKEKISLEEDEIFGKEFLIEEPLEQPKWQMVNETKKIGDYTCMKAELIIPVSEKQKQDYSDFLKREEKKPALFKMEEPKDKVIVAWYTPEIPVSFGPNNYWGLPGLILEINEENLVVLCSKVVLNSKEKLKIKRPNTGDKVSKKEFDRIQKKKMDSMKNEDGIIIHSFEN